jgi:hypothetical protein
MKANAWREVMPFSAEVRVVRRNGGVGIEPTPCREPVEPVDHRHVGSA